MNMNTTYYSKWITTTMHINLHNGEEYKYGINQIIYCTHKLAIIKTKRDTDDECNFKVYS